jgi:acetyl-CoA carboxylase carboxyltransferase component
MSVITSRINVQSATYQANYRQMSAMLENLENELAKSRYQGEPKHIDRAKKAGKMLARERIELLLDPNSPFLELAPLAGLNQGGFGAGGTMVGGIGLVSGRLCMINANVGTNKGGAIDFFTLQKALRISQIARENGLPTINLVESSGANLPEQAKIFVLGGENFREITRRSKMGIPSISIVFGNSTAGGAYIPGMSDYIIMVKNQAKVFLAGPPLVKMATNEIVDDETLGGADMHSKISGVSDYLARNEAEGIRLAREIVAYLRPPDTHYIPPAAIAAPRYAADELLGIISADVRKPFDAREVIARITDGSEFSEFKPDFGTTLVCGYAHIQGYKVGILANNGVLFSDSSNKGAHFIQLCNRNDIPLVFLQNITGFMVGKEYEQGGIIKHGAKLINAVSNSTVPILTIMMGASYGAGNYGMAGRAYEPRFLFSLPNHQIAVMGPEQLAGVMQMVQREAAQKMGAEIDEEQSKQMRDYMIKEVEKQSNALYATSQLWDDGIIDPRQMRNVLGFTLAIVNNIPIKGATEYGIFRM